MSDAKVQTGLFDEKQQAKLDKGIDKLFDKAWSPGETVEEASTRQTGKANHDPESETPKQSKAEQPAPVVPVQAEAATPPTVTPETSTGIPAHDPRYAKLKFKDREEVLDLQNPEDYKKLIFDAQRGRNSAQTYEEARDTYKKNLELDAELRKRQTDLDKRQQEIDRLQREVDVASVLKRQNPEKDEYGYDKQPDPNDELRRIISEQQKRLDGLGTFVAKQHQDALKASYERKVLSELQSFEEELPFVKMDIGKELTFRFMAELDLPVDKAARMANEKLQADWQRVHPAQTPSYPNGNGQPQTPAKPAAPPVMAPGKSAGNATVGKKQINNLDEAWAATVEAGRDAGVFSN